MTPFNSTERTATIALTPNEEAFVRTGIVSDVRVQAIIEKLRRSLQTSDALMGPVGSHGKTSG